MSRCSTHVALRLLALLFLLPAVWSATFTMTNNCGYTVWPGLLSGAGTAPLSTTGFALAHGASATVDAPASWSGRMWARTLCAEDATGKLTCATGDCGSGGIQCNGGGAAPPATLVEFTLDGSGGMDFFDVSLVDGYNLPMLVVPQGGGGAASGGAAVACRSACEAFGSPQYCCSGAYGNPNTCRPSTYSQFFKNACPRAYSYAYDDSTSTFTCATGTNYAITFCPSTTSGKVSGVENPQAAAAGVPSTDGTMVVLGAEQLSTTSSAVLAAPQLMMLLLPLVAAVL
ncbi:thaumatin-like protein 1b isoform X2 [Oryza brachyantha]|uniref:thaumatin-like protein 1b isoform X2 n=1 Tax=Oryza brachyantha TaxID=4533 RepID=UPI001ADB3959|nr:thaumatin-like protein 1b isoform X2 [Oryza brachyantha]